MDSLTVSNNCKCIGETDSAIFVVLMNFLPYKAIWIPKISLTGFGDVFAKGDYGTLSVKKYFANKNLDAKLSNVSNTELINVGPYAEIIEDYGNAYLMEFDPKPVRLRIVIPKGVMKAGKFSPSPFMTITVIKWWADMHGLSGHEIDYSRSPGLECVFDHAIAVRESPKAICVSFGYTNDNEEWVPKSVIGDSSEVKKAGDDGKIVVFSWYAKKTGWV